MNSTNAAEYAGTMGEGYDAKSVLLKALRFNKAMKERKEYLYKAKSKMALVLEIIERFQLKTVTFSESTEFADEITEKTESISVCYHSLLKTQIRNGKKFGKTRLRREAIQKFADNRYKVRVINTAKALDQGFDVEDVELAVITSSTTNPTQHIQRVGRAVRHYTYKSGLKKGSNKKAIIINIYIKDSQDLKWLKARQTDPKTKKPINPNVIWVDHLDEIFYGRKIAISESGNLRATCD
jgi:superfamily II DNA or RNA helicase